jgi:glycosyltransferase involved in cell wall biosynthesis
MGDPLITILTPSYNRAHTLPRLAASLLKQGKASFEWLVVDDGSTDGTESYLGKVHSEGALELKTVRFENGGKQRAVNRAIGRARGAWTYIVDSDDALPPLALERITRHIERIEDDNSIGGIMGLKALFSGALVGEVFPKGLKTMSATDITFKSGIRGDKADLYRTEILRRFPFPEFEGENFITECVAWYRIAQAGYKLSITNEVLYLCEYLSDGLSARSLQLRVKNPQGTLLFYKEELSLHYRAKALFREAINYVRFALLCGGLWGCARSLAELNGRARALALAALPAGSLAAILDARKLKGI